MPVLLQHLIIGGDEFNFQPQLGRLDASFGDVLINDACLADSVGQGKGNFSVLSQNQSGLALKGQVRDIISVKVKNKTNLFFLQNNEYPLL